MSTSHRFIIDITFDDDEEQPANSSVAADQLLDALTRCDDYPDWVLSVDDVNPARLEMYR